jgi:hypothetical protein
MCLYIGLKEDFENDVAFLKEQQQNSVAVADQLVTANETISTLQGVIEVYIYTCTHSFVEIDVSMMYAYKSILFIFIYEYLYGCQ